ncbi:hypothetical protein EON82_20750 [bacterium]|nr:MAG: hypothetical protein EON82_20750 [bacterium]
MTLFAALLIVQAPLTAADFFPLKPGVRRIYEVKSEAKLTLIEEVGPKPASFDGADAIPVLSKNAFNQTMETTYYRIDGSEVLMVGFGEMRTVMAERADDKTIDLTKTTVKKYVLMQMKPPMPVFRFDGKETAFNYNDVPIVQGESGEAPVKGDPTALKGTAKLGKERTVLGRKVETLEVKTETQLGDGLLGEKVIETSVYGRGIGLIEKRVQKTGGGNRKKSDTRTTLVGIEEPKAGS